MKPAKKLLLNTLALTAVSLLMRTIGMSFGVYLSNTIGPEGIGAFELIMSVYTLAVSLAASGVRLSTTRLVVEARSRGTHSDRRVMALCLRYALTLGLISGAVLLGASGWLATTFLRAPEAARALRILAPGLPFLAVSSALSGYFTARRKAARFAATQLLEQLLRIGITICALHVAMPLGVAHAPLALVVGSCTAEVLSTAVAYSLFRAELRGRRGVEAASPLLGRLLAIAVPDAVGSWVRSGLVTAKNLLIPRGLEKTGASSRSALATYGTIQGMVLPVLTFPSAFLGALAALLIPEVAESAALGHRGHIRYVLSRVIHVTMIFSVAVAGVLFFFAEPLGEAIYPCKGTGLYIRLLAPVVPIMYLDMMVDSALKGLGHQLSSMSYNIIDAAMSLFLVWLLIPRLGIAGYCLTFYASELLNFYLSMGKLTKETATGLAFGRSFAGPAAAMVLAGTLARRVTLPLVPAVLMCLALYAALLVALSCVRREDIQWVKSVLGR